MDKRQAQIYALYMAGMAIKGTLEGGWMAGESLPEGSTEQDEQRVVDALYRISDRLMERAESMDGEGSIAALWQQAKREGGKD